VKDSIVRGRLLQLLFERRNEGPLPFGAAEGAIEPPGGIDNRDWLLALARLVENELVSWQAVSPEPGKGRMAGLAEITERGVDVVDGRETPDIDIRFADL
jgi:hypothetical protein